MNIEVVFPNKEKQISTARKITEKLEDIDKALEISKKSISDYQLLKNSVIADVVSGKINQRGQEVVVK